MAESPKLKFAFDDEPESGPAPKTKRSREDVSAIAAGLDRERGITREPARAKPGPKPQERKRSDRIVARAYPEYGDLARFFFKRFQTAEVVERAMILLAEETLQDKGEQFGLIIVPSHLEELRELLAAAKSAK